MKYLDIFLVYIIDFYQRYISPYKGFKCAYSVYHSSESCSQWAKKTIFTDGSVSFFQRLFGRLSECRKSSLLLSINNEKHGHQDNDDNSKPQKKTDSCEDTASCCFFLIPW
jgi:putative component of membrane protein insertase Oxa1/YidC/SpoIIIJ protein YidD